MGWYYVISQEIRESFEGKEADVFAVINDFSQEGQGCFYGSLSLLSQFCGIKSKTTTQKILKSLVEKGAIVKGEDLHNGVKFCTYKVNKNWYSISKIDMEGISKIDTNNKEYINNNTLSIKGGAHFQKPSLDDIRAYCIGRSNNVDPEQFFNFYESKGWVVGKSPMKDWRAAVRTWEKREKEIPQRKRSPLTRSESVFEHNLRAMDQMFGSNLHEQAYGNRGGQADEQ